MIHIVLHYPVPPSTFVSEKVRFASRWNDLEIVFCSSNFEVERSDSYEIEQRAERSNRRAFQDVHIFYYFDSRRRHGRSAFSMNLNVSILRDFQISSPCFLSLAQSVVSIISSE